MPEIACGFEMDCSSWLFDDRFQGVIYTVYITRSNSSDKYSAPIIYNLDMLTVETKSIPKTILCIEALPRRDHPDKGMSSSSNEQLAASARPMVMAER